MRLEYIKRIEFETHLGGYKFRVDTESNFYNATDLTRFCNGKLKKLDKKYKPKKINDFLLHPATKKYMSDMCVCFNKKYGYVQWSKDYYNPSKFLEISHKKGMSGTWFHKNLFILYGIWLDDDFPIFEAMYYL